MIYVLLLITIGFGIARFIVPVEGKINKRDIFKDMAHLFVGFVFGYAANGSDWEPWALAVGLTVLEVVAFLVRKAS